MELYSTCISHDWESELNMYINLHLREEVLKTSISWWTISFIYIKGKHENLSLTQVRKYRKTKVREKENWSIEKDAHLDPVDLHFVSSNIKQKFSGF